MAQTPDTTDTVLIFDTTLRDGEQAPGASMTFRDKIEVAEALESLGVDIIEAGFPIASEGDFRAVSEIARRAKEPIICGLARAFERDVDRCAEAVRHAARPRINVFLSTSPVHMKHKLQKDAEEVHEMVGRQIARARNHTDDVEWTAEDGTRTEFDFLCRCVETAIRSGAGTINIPDTVGYATPEEYAAIFRNLRERVPNADQVVLSAHCHNDLGLGVANTLAAIGAGARQVECTINGIGERAGNAALEEIVMALHTRRDKFGCDTAVNTRKLIEVSRIVEAASGFAVQVNKAIVGGNAFAHASGVHQDGMLKNAQTYEIISPETVGLETSMVLSKHSGRHAFRERLKHLQIRLDDDALLALFAAFKALADNKKVVSDDDLRQLVSAHS